jgi:hypothetical protein
MNPTSEPLFVDDDADGESFNLFEAIGFDVLEERDFFDLFDYAESAGFHSVVNREDYALQGSCWKVGDGLEIWTFSFIARNIVEYEDCRPGFRSRHTHILQPWELIEYEEGGDAVLRGMTENAVEVLFQLQNLTELTPQTFDFPYLHVAFAGLAYAMEVRSGTSLKQEEAHFELAEKRPQGATEFYFESDYFIHGRILAWRYFSNPITENDLAWVYVDAGSIRLEVLVNRQALHGRLRVGAAVSAKLWLQGHVLNEADLEARYEGVDPESDSSDHWAALRRGN